MDETDCNERGGDTMTFGSHGLNSGDAMMSWEGK